MPISRYQIRNEYSLADPELYRAADKDDPEALLEGVAMAGLVGVLRQLGDLAEFAAEIFHDLHEEVMVTAARGHRLMARVQQLEAEFPSIERVFLSQTNHSSFLSNAGTDWHPNLQSEQNLVTHGDLPRFVMDSYEECRGPPRLFLLDKFDVAGAGACLKRYTDPSFFKMETASSGIARAEVHREKRTRKIKKKGTRWRNGETPEMAPAHTKLHQLLLEERIENAYTDPARLVKLKKRQLNWSAIESKAGKSYMEKFLETPSPDQKMVCETSIMPLPKKLSPDATSEAGVRILEISTISPSKRPTGHKSPCSSPTEHEFEIKPSLDMDGETNGDLVKMHEQMPAGVTDEISSNHFELPAETEFAIDEKDKIEGGPDGYDSDDVTSDVDNYLDALATIDSEVETDNEYKSSFLNVQKAMDTDGKEGHQRQSQFSDCQSSGEDSTSDENISSKRDNNQEHTEKQAHFSDSDSIGTSPTSKENSSFKRYRNEGHKEQKAQFSDSHSIGASSVSDESNSLKKDRNEEWMALQAQFSDFQSIGNSSMSDENISFKKDRSCFSHSDSLGPVVENIESDGYKALEFLSSTECRASEIEDNQSNLLPQIVQSQKTDCSETHIKEEGIPDSGQAFSMTSEHMSLHSGCGATSSAAPSACNQFDEKPTVPVEYQLDEDWTYPVDHIASVPNAPSSMKEDVFPMVSSEKNPVNKVDDGDSYLDSHDLSQVSNALASAPEDRHDYHSEINVLPTESQNSSSGKNPSCPSMASDLSSGTVLLPDSLDLKSEAALKATQPIMESLSPVVENSPASGFKEEKFSDVACDSSQEEPVSAGVEVLYYDQQAHVEEISGMVHHDELNGSNHRLGAVEDDGHHDYPSSLDSEGLMNHFMKNDLVTEKVEENGAVSDVPSVDSTENDANIVRCTDSGQESLHLGSSNSHQMEMESNWVELAEAFTELEAGKRENQLETSSDMASSNSIMRNLCNAQESTSTSSSIDDTEKEMEFNEAGAKESLTAFEAQMVVDQHEIVSNGSIPSLMRDSTNSDNSVPTFVDPNEKYADVNGAGDSKFSTDLTAPKLVDHLEVAFAELQSSLNRSVSCEPPDLETGNDIENLAFKEQTQNSIVNDELMLPQSLGVDIEESESKPLCHSGVLQKGKDDTSSTYCNHLESEAPLEQLLQSSVDQEDEESGLRDVENPVSERLKSKQMQISDQSEQERSFHAASESAFDSSLDHAPPSLDSLLPSTGQKLNPSHGMDPLSTFLPDHLPKAAGINPEEMPPMPPLPPMQWRIGKVQHTPLASQRELNDVSGPSFPTTQPVKTGETARFSLLGSERQTWQYQNPFLPVLAVEGDKLQHASGFSVGFPGHPVAIPLQFPVVFNESNSPYKYLYLDRSSQYLQSPFVTLPMVSTGRPLNGEHAASDGDVTNYTTSGPPVPPVENASEHDSPQGKVAQPSNQIMSDASLEVNALEKSSDNPEGGHGDPAISSKSLPSMETTLPHINMLPSDDEMALSSDSSALTSDFEGERPNGKLRNKLPRPRNPLIDAVAAHDKSKLRKVTERVMPQISQKEDERDSLLEQIRTKSFNLKPATVTRPSVQGPKTNLKVAAILEKANAIRQALAGSDEDDDADRWSDS